jgi:hypothetical protein
MDPDRFDQLATLVGGGSRRGVLRGLLGSALVAWELVRWEPAEEVAAGEKPVRRVQERTPQRNDKQRTRRHRHHRERDRQDQDGGRLGGREASVVPCKDNGLSCKRNTQCCFTNCVDGTCQPNTPHVCSGQAISNPCFPFDASTCGANGTCRCGTDLDGNLTCYENAYCNDPRFDTHCASNADCVAKGFAPGSVCFSAENCCLGGADATGCTSPCPSPST